MLALDLVFQNNCSCRGRGRFCEMPSNLPFSFFRKIALCGVRTSFDCENAWIILNIVLLKKRRGERKKKRRSKAAAGAGRRIDG